jgi:DNA-binding transcriptional MerR regulator
VSPAPEVRHTSPLPIGAVAAASGVTVETVRFYERLGLIPTPTRTAGGLRRFPPEVVARLAFITQAKTLGLSLSEIALLTAGASQPAGACRAVQQTVERHLAEIDRKLAELVELRATLVQYREACIEARASSTEPACPTLASLGGSVLTQTPVQRAGRSSRRR